jgi:hypothetical protein
MRRTLTFGLLLILYFSAVVFAQRGTVFYGARMLIEKTGSITLTPKSGQKTVVSRQFVPYSTKTALTPSATVAITSTVGNFFTLTPGEDETINATTVGAQGQPLFIEVVTSGTTSRTLTFGTNFKSTGTLATGTTTAKTFMLQFLSDGTNYVEVSRTAAQ